MAWPHEAKKNPFGEDTLLINNRQNGRRRGRGGPGQGGRQQGGGGAGPGNRQDNRSRGNAAQLYEKYKALARDTQLAGDRVQTEYYLQFADHYFRVLNETRSRFEEQRRPRDDYMQDEDEDQDEGMEAAESGETAQPQERDERLVLFGGGFGRISLVALCRTELDACGASR